MQQLADTYMQNESFAKESRLIAKQKSKQQLFQIPIRVSYIAH